MKSFKNHSRFLAMVLSLVMCLGLCQPAFAGWGPNCGDGNHTPSHSGGNGYTTCATCGTSFPCPGHVDEYCGWHGGYDKQEHGDGECDYCHYPFRDKQCPDYKDDVECDHKGYDEYSKRTKDPTCTEVGEDQYFCSNCDQPRRQKSVPALGHKFGGATTWVDNCATHTDANCTGHTKVCENCNGTLEGGTQSGTHSFSGWMIVARGEWTADANDPDHMYRTVTVEGTCACGHKTRVDVSFKDTDRKGVPDEELQRDKNAKTFTVWYLVKNGGTSTPALGSYTVSLKETDSPKAVVIAEFEGYKYDSMDRETIAYTDEIDPPVHVYYTLKHVHDYGDGAVTKEANCVEEGEMTYTCACGVSYTEVIDALGHDIENVAWADGCDTNTDENCTGHTKVCTRCEGKLDGGIETEDHTFVWGEPVFSDWFAVEGDDEYMYRTAAVEGTCVCGHKKTETYEYNDGKDKVGVTDDQLRREKDAKSFDVVYLVRGGAALGSYTVSLKETDAAVDVVIAEFEGYTFDSADRETIAYGDEEATVYVYYTVDPVVIVPDPFIPTPVTPAPAEDEEIEDNETPMAAEPEEEEIVDNEIPQAAEPEVQEPAEEPAEEEIIDDDIPLADVPKTGDLSAVWYAATALSALGLTVLGRKKEEEDD